MKFEIIAGDFSKKSTYSSFMDKPRLSWPKPNSFLHEEVLLSGNVERVEIVTEENKKKMLGSVGWGLTGAVVGGLIAAPIAIAAGLAGLLKGGNKKEICFACYLKDGRKFMAVVDPKIYMQISSLAF
jgi:hypothetical protein